MGDYLIWSFDQEVYITAKKNLFGLWIMKLENVVFNYQGSKKDTKLFHTGVYSIVHCT